MKISCYRKLSFLVLATACVRPSLAANWCCLVPFWLQQWVFWGDDSCFCPRTAAVPRFEGYWEPVKGPPDQLREAQGGVMNGGNDLVIVSGFVNGFGQSSKENHALDLTNPKAEWRRLADLPVVEGITHGSAIVAGGGDIFYMCGGYLGGVPGPAISDCLEYDFPLDEWSRLPDLPEGRGGGGMIYDEDANMLIYTGGGVRPNAGGSFTVDYGDTWMLDLSDTSTGWTTRTDIPFPVNHMSFVTGKDKFGKNRHFFLAGQSGEDEDNGNTDENFEYDVATDTWTARASLPQGRGHAASSTRAIGRGFIIVGGVYNGDRETGDISYYDIPSDTWTKIGSLPGFAKTPVCDFSGDYLYCQNGDLRVGYRRKIVVES